MSQNLSQNPTVWTYPTRLEGNMLIELTSDSEDYFGPLEAWLATAGLDDDEKRLIRETLARGEDYASDDEAHGVWLHIHPVWRRQR